MPKSGRATLAHSTKHLKLVGVKPQTFKSVYLRDGAVVLHKRADSTVWQVRFKLYDRRWHAMSTKQHDLEYAKQAACEIYDEARFRERYGLAPTRRKFHAIAEVTVKDLAAEIKAGIVEFNRKLIKKGPNVQLKIDHVLNPTCLVIRQEAQGDHNGHDWQGQKA